MIYNPYPNVNLPYGKDNKYFKQLFDAITMVGEKYVHYSIPCGEDRYQYVPHLERVFAYELYRMWGNMLSEMQEDLVLNGEIDKIININGIEYEDDSADSSGGKGNTVLYPDIVLHHSQSDDNKQLIICEIKRSHNLKGCKLFADIYKVSCYLTKGIFGEGKKQFQYGVVLLVDTDLSIISDKISKETEITDKSKNKKIKFSDFIKDEKMLPSFKRIVCIAYNGVQLEYQTLDKIIETNFEED